MKDRTMWRSRWAAVGAAIAVSLGGGGFFLANAAPAANESTIVTVTPTRVLDTRDPVNLGLPGPFTSPASQKLQITGVVPVAGGGTSTVVPTGATGVLLNVTAVSPTAAGFVSIRPGDATGAPTTSSLNVEAGSNLPNAVQVALPTTGANAGKIDITYDAYGVAGKTTELLIDIVGYMTNTGLQELVTDVANLHPVVTVLDYAGSNTDAAPTTAFKLIRTVGNFTKQRGDSTLRLDWSAHHTLIGAGAFCHYQIRIDGRANDGDNATNFQPDQEGNAVSYATDESLATFVEFTGVPAGVHTVQIFERGTGTSCELNRGNFNQQVVVEEYSPAPASSFDAPVMAADGEAVQGGI